VCSLRSMPLAVLRSASIFCLVLSISCVSRQHTIPPKSAIMSMTDCLGKAKEVESGTVIHSPVALVTQRYQAVRSSAMIFFASSFQLNLLHHQSGCRPSADCQKRE